MTLRARWTRSKKTGAERSPEHAQQPWADSPGERPASQDEASGKDNLWSFLRHGPVSWAAVMRALVALCGVAILVALLLLILSVLGFVADFGFVYLGPAALPGSSASASTIA